MPLPLHHTDQLLLGMVQRFQRFASEISTAVPDIKIHTFTLFITWIADNFPELNSLVLRFIKTFFSEFGIFCKCHAIGNFQGPQQGLYFGQPDYRISLLDWSLYDKFMLTFFEKKNILCLSI